MVVVAVVVVVVVVVVMVAPRQSLCKFYISSVLNRLRL